MSHQNISPEQLSYFKRLFEQKKCFYPNCGISSTIKAHSIQENGPLKYIADLINKQKEVYYLDDEFDFDKDSDGMVSKQSIKRKLHHRGIAAASIFNGFCKKHDIIFKNTIEDVPYTGSVEQLFYHTYRSYAYFMHKKYESYKSVTATMEEVQKTATNKIDFPEIPKNDQLGKFGDQLNDLMKGLSGMLKGLDGLFETLKEKSNQELFGLSLKKARLDEAIEKFKYSDLKYWQKSVSGLYPIACSSVVHYIDTIHQPSSDGVVYPAELAITIFPDPNKSKTHFIVGGFDDNPNFEILMHKLRAIDTAHFLKFMSDLLVHRGSNIYISPRMYNKMTTEEQNELIDQRAATSHCVPGLPQFKINLFDPKLLDVEGS